MVGLIFYHASIRQGKKGISRIIFIGGTNHITRFLNVPAGRVRDNAGIYARMFHLPTVCQLRFCCLHGDLFCFFLQRIPDRQRYTPFTSDILQGSICCIRLRFWFFLGVGGNMPSWYTAKNSQQANCYTPNPFFSSVSAFSSHAITS